MDLYAITNQEVLDRLSRHHPRAISTYLQIINRADSNGQVFFSKDLVTIEMSESWTKFKNDIRSLAQENLIKWIPFNDGISVSIADPEDHE